MNKPRLTLLDTTALRLFAAVLVSLGLSQCAHQPTQTRSPAELGWHVVSKEPLVYAPDGHTPPPYNRYDPPLHVSLADGKTRFYIPRGDVSHMRQALAWRNASLDEEYRRMPGWKKAGMVALGIPAVATEVAVTAALGAAFVGGGMVGSVGPVY